MNEKPSKKELQMLRQKLKSDGKNICYGELCNGIVKSVDEFVKNQNYCHVCNRYKVKKSHKKIPRAHRRIKYKLKAGKACEKCECCDINMFDFDHLDQDRKSFAISSKDSTTQIKDEYKKTRILCVWCHRLHSQTQIEKNLKKSREDYEYGDDEENEEIDLNNSKVCKGEFCKGVLRNGKYFYVSKNKLSGNCKKCHNYNGMINRRKNKEHCDNHKLKIGGCKKCDRKVTKETTCCFDFDHVIRDNKSLNISRLVQHSHDVRDNIDYEIKKCQLLCCYCHRKKTNRELNYEILSENKLHELDDLRKTGSKYSIECSKD